MENKETKNVSISMFKKKDDFTNGQSGHLMHKMGLGASVPAIGYYKLIKVRNENTDKKASQPVLAYFNSESPNNFVEEEVSFEAKFLYNKMSIGNKGASLAAGMIIHIKETSLVDADYNGKSYQTYKIVWDIINANKKTHQTSNENYTEYLEYSPEELDDMYRDAFDGEEDAYWNID